MKFFLQVATYFFCQFVAEETKEQLLGFYIIEVDNLEEGLEFARELTKANPGGAYELRPIMLYNPGTPVEQR